MKRFNLSEWAVTHRPMVLFLIIATLIVGVNLIADGLTQALDR